jgi:hypothetical protein
MNMTQRVKQDWFQPDKNNVVPFVRNMGTTLTQSTAVWLDPTMARLNDLVSKLPDNWDGYGGTAVNFLNAVFAINMLNSICHPNTPAPSIVPGQHGDLQIEWHTRRFDIELDIVAPNKVSVYLHDLEIKSESTEIELENDFTVITTWINALTEAEVATKSAAA